MIKALNKREKIILSATFSVIASSIAFNLFIGPALKRSDALNKEISLTKSRLRKYLQLLSEKDGLQRKYDKFFKHLGLSEEDEKAPLGALSELEKLSKASGIRILDIRPQGPSGRPGAQKASAIDLRAEGTMEEYIRFIYAVESSSLFLRIKKFQLSAKPNTSALEGVFSVDQVSLTSGGIGK